MLLSEVNARSRGRTQLSVHLARDAAEVREAQRLRWRVFADEMGARLQAAEPGVDSDLFDPWCEHLIVREHGNGEVIGTYRILTGARARELGYDVFVDLKLLDIPTTVNKAARVLGSLGVSYLTLHARGDAAKAKAASG